MIHSGLLRRAVLVEHDRLAFVRLVGVLCRIQGLLLFVVIQIIEIVVARSLAGVKRLKKE